MQARLIKGIQKPRPEFETVGACLIMLHGISDAGANFECWYVEFLGHQEQHLEFIDAAAAHMSAYDDNPRAQARAILRMDGADLRTRNEEELATLSSKCLTTWTRAIIRGMKGGTGFKAGNAQRRGCGDNTQDGGLAPPSLVCSFRAKVALERQTQDKVCHANQHAPQLLASLQSSRTSDAWQSSVHPTQSSACMQCAVASTEQVLVPSHPRSRCVSRRIHRAGA